MADVKRILVVDDHFEMLEFLRSMLEVSGHDFEVLAVPSAEEGMLELLRTRFDLLITDVRLPGMSGFDFVRRIRRRLPDLPVIMITAYSSPQGQEEAKELNVYRYFRKPLDTDGMLTAVRTALYGEVVVEVGEVEKPIPQVNITLSDNVRRRLQTLRADTGASGLVLATVHGQVLLELGEQRRLEIAELIKIIAQNMQNSFTLATQLGETDPFTLQYHTGQTIELYNANIGHEFFISLFYNVGTRRGRIGTIWVFAQRAIKELVDLLPVTEDKGTSAALPSLTPVPSEETKPARPHVEPVQLPITKPEPAPAAISKPDLDLPVPEPVEVDMDGLLAALNLDETAVAIDVDSFWDEALIQGESELQAKNTLSFTEAVSLVEGLPELTDISTTEPEEPVAEEADITGLLDALNLQDQSEDVDLDAFWDDAMDGGSGGGQGLSFEEAREQGLISTEIDANENG